MQKLVSALRTRSWLLLFCLLFSIRSEASFVIAPNLTFRTQRVVDNTGALDNIESRYSTLDLRGGYLWPEANLYAGVLYSYQSDGFLNGNASGWGVGPSVGYVRDAFSLVLTYQLAGSRTFSIGGGERKLSKGTGILIDFAWTPQLTENFGFGPMISWRAIRYDQSQIGANPESGNGYEDTVITPGLAFWYSFGGSVAPASARGAMPSASSSAPSTSPTPRPSEAPLDIEDAE